MLIVKFTKHFVSGMLKGLTYDESLPMANLDSAARYVAFLHEHVTNPIVTDTGSDYTCHCARIVTSEQELNTV